ncbi:GNAT family N-acetyltransferase [Paracoccus jeotgali]|uniref:GNAT family N-acetyltransferase n=1 Tax=Paracoccus jeotgali TaxID=2065379 RepID=UPI0028AAC6A0|nr:hypothetical protein [Paracoccus jeotgali]
MAISKQKRRGIFLVPKIIRDRIADIDHILLLRKPLERPNHFRRIEPKQMTFHVVTSESELGPLIAQFPQRARFFREYIANGIVAFYAMKDHAVIAYLFATDKDFHDRHLWKNTVHVKPKEFFHFAGFVAPGSRGSIAALFVLQNAHAYFKDRGFRTAVTTVSSRNEASWRVCLKFGYDQKDQAWDVYKLFGWRWSRTVPVRIWVR